MQADVVEQESPRYLATLGLEALRHLDLVVDGKHGVAYVRPLEASLSDYHYRAGVAFVPEDLQHPKADRFARVLEGTPAYEAGIRNGDVLLKVNGRSWTELPEGPNDVSMQHPPGTSVAFTVRRGGTTFTATVVLQELLAPKSEKTPGAPER